jgi:hypothetical protein
MPWIYRLGLAALVWLLAAALLVVLVVTKNGRAKVGTGEGQEAGGARAAPSAEPPPETQGQSVAAEDRSDRLAYDELAAPWGQRQHVEGPIPYPTHATHLLADA